MSAIDAAKIAACQDTDYPVSVRSGLPVLRIGQPSPDRLALDAGTGEGQHP